MHHPRPIIQNPMPAPQIQQQSQQQQPQQQQQQQQPPTSQQQLANPPQPSVATAQPPNIPNVYPTHPYHHQNAAYPAPIGYPGQTAQQYGQYQVYQYPQYSFSQYHHVPQSGYTPSGTVPQPASVNQQMSTTYTTPPQTSYKSNREKKILVFTNPDTKEPIILGDNVNATKQTNSKNTTAPSKPAVLKPAPNTDADASTKTSDQPTIETAKSSSIVQATTAQAKTLTSNIANNTVATNESTNKSNSLKQTGADIATTNDKTNTKSASSLAVQNEFACKVSERAGMGNTENKASVKQEGNLASHNHTKDELDSKNEDISVNKTVENTSRAGDEIIKNNTKQVTTNSQSDVITSEPAKSVVIKELFFIEKSDKKDNEIIQGESKSKTTSDDSNKENVDTEFEANQAGTELHYEPGQYNPKTRSGKRVYNRDFLYAVRDIITKEDPIEVNDPLNIYSTNATGNNFMPSYLNSRSNDQASWQQYRGRLSDRQERQNTERKIIPTSSLGQEVELKTSENAWKPSKEIRNDGSVVRTESEIEILKKQFKSILNKLTPNNFDTLAEKVKNLGIDTEEKLADVIDIVFAKALAEPGYSVLYGRMCSYLKEISAGKAEFAKTLLQRCQNQFQADTYSGLDVEGRKKLIEEESDADKKKNMNEELYEDMFRCRMRSLGLVKFIGELYKCNMLNDAIMFSCIDRLLLDISDESLDSLCDLLTTIGHKLDESSKELGKQIKNKPRNQTSTKPNAYSDKSLAAVVAQGPRQEVRLITLDPIFQRLHTIRKDNTNSLSVRIRFKVLDICELREKDNWLSKKTKDNNPKKIEEIREAHMEKLEMEKQRNASMVAPRRSQEGRRGLGQSGGSSSQLSSMASDSGGRIGGLHMSASNSSIRDHSMNDNSKSSDVEAHARAKQNVSSIFKQLTGSTPNSNSTKSTCLRPAASFTRKP